MLGGISSQNGYKAASVRVCISVYVPWENVQLAAGQDKPGGRSVCLHAGAACGVRGVEFVEFFEMYLKLYFYLHFRAD